LGLISIDSNIYITTFHNSPPTTAAIVPIGATPPSTQSQLEEAGTQQAEAANAEERVVVIEALTADGKPLLDANGDPISVGMSDSVLDNLDELFKNLPDGRYRISVIEPGETRARTLLEVNLRGHKQSDDAEEGEGKPPASDEGSAADSSGAPQAALPDRALREDSTIIPPGMLLDAPLATRTDVRLPAAAVISLAPADTAAPTRDGNEDRHDGELPAGSRPGLQPAPQRSAAEITLGLGAVAACLGGRNWEERVDAALAQAGAGALSKRARMARRLMRPPEKDLRRMVHRFGFR
jgi:hypothetical protein